MLSCTLRAWEKFEIMQHFNSDRITEFQEKNKTPFILRF
eukprot:gene5283-3788_t